MTVPGVEPDAGLFEERAENLTDEQFLAWTAPTPHERQVLRQLTSQGPKLLSGPRGSGKTTLLLTAARHMLAGQRALPVYVNYGRSMFIEPAFSRRADADGFFQDWLVARLIQGAIESIEGAGSIPPDLADLASRAAAFIDAAESNPMTERAAFPGPTSLAKMLERWGLTAQRPNVVLLLDDAAHAFVPEQQQIFFEFLRNIRTPGVTFKAAIYPGVTEFSPNFHVGHDAKVVPAWLKVEGPEYLDFMWAAYERRLPPELQRLIPREVVDLFAGACFGIPRTFFSMIEEFLDVRVASPRGSATTRIPLTVMADYAGQLRGLHRSLSTKLPRYSAYVQVGERVLDRTLSQVRDLNEERSRRRQGADQATEVAVRQPVDSRLTTVFGLLEYAGLIRQTNESVSLGHEGTYSKFAIHGCLLSASASLKYGKNPTARDRADSLIRAARTGSYKRVGSDVLLPPLDAQECQLSVGNCHKCGAPRNLEGARFCSNCGAELTDASRLSELLGASIDELTLTPRKKAALHGIGMSTLDSLVRDRGLTQIGRADHVGPVWARRIHSLAVEFVGV